MRLADAAATEALGARVADALLARAADEGAVRGVVHLRGPLGAGKTTLVRGLVRRLGFPGPVKSPTYTLIEPYTRGGLRVYHMDLYRLGDPEELELLGARDYLDAEAVVLVEWPERAGAWLPAPDLEVRLAVADGAREATVRARGRHGEALAEAAEGG